MDELSYESINFDTLFANEETAYAEIITNFEKSDSYPKYYYSHNRYLDACIVLGDFTINGWKMCKQLVNLSIEHILLAVEELGKFHGESYALKDMNPIQFNDIVDKFKESRYHKEETYPVWDTLMSIAPTRITKSVQNSTIKDKIPMEFLTKLETLFSNQFRYGSKMTKPIEPMAIICHGDFLRNNLAFKYDYIENNKSNGNDDVDDDKNNIETLTPVAAMMFDFQTLRYASPMIDLTTFIANSTGIDVRSIHFEEIFKKYHNSLIDIYCKKTGKSKVNLPEYFSYESFLKEYALYLPYGLSIASFFLCELHEPSEIPPIQLLQMDLPIEYHIDLLLTKGGERVNREFVALVNDIYELNKRFNLELLTY